MKFPAATPDLFDSYDLSLVRRNIPSFSARPETGTSAKAASERGMYCPPPTL